MTGNVLCPRCGQVYAVHLHMAGLNIQCTQCGQVFQAPAAGPAGLVPSSAPGAVGPASYPRPSMSDSDRVLLAVGGALAAIALMCLLIVFPLAEFSNKVAAVLVLLLGLVGACLVLGGLRKQMLAGGGIAAGILVLLLAGVVLSVKSGGDEPPVARAPAPEAPAPAWQPPSVTLPSAITQPPAAPSSVEAPPASSSLFPPDLTPTGIQVPRATAMSPSEPGPSLPAPGSIPRAPQGGKPAPAVASSSPPMSNTRPSYPSGAQSSSPSGPQTPSTAPTELSASAAAALNSVVLVEHPLGSGSGFAVAKDLVVTNAHVVDGAFPDEIKIQFGTENNAPKPIARILYFDRPRDLCVIEVETELPGLRVRDDYVMRPGEQVVLMGNPSVKGGMLMRNATNHGRMSRRIRIEGQDFYGIDASVNPGWSGGPVVDADGSVIAVVAMKADDQAVAEIRGAMQRLDDSFQPGRGPGMGVGITYGIPAGALARVLQHPKLHDEARQAAANDRYLAQTVLERLGFLATLSMLRMQVNVPVQVRLEAKAMEQGDAAPRSRLSRVSGVKVEYIALIPEEIAPSLSAALKSREIREQEKQFRQRIDERLEAVQESEQLADSVKRDLKNLAKKIKDAEQYVERPGNTYAAFSLKVKGFSRDLKELLQRIEGAVEDRTP